MAVKTALSEEAYLRTSFPGVDQEFRDGDLVERGMPDLLHSTAQQGVVYFFSSLLKQDGLPFYARPELRHRIRAGRYVIPDVAVFWPAKPVDAIPSQPPFIAIEILSPDDRMTEVRDKLREYLDWGVPHVWLIDPRQRVISVFDHEGLRDVPSVRVPETDHTLTAAELLD